MLSNSKQNTQKLIVGLLLAVALISILFNSILIYHLKTLYVNYRQQQIAVRGQSEATNIAPNPQRNEGLVILFGDSRIKMWTPLPSAGNFTFLNAGVAGETTAEMSLRLNSDVLTHNPDTVIIQAGINDITAAATYGISEPQLILKNCLRNIEYFITDIQKIESEIVLMSIIEATALSIPRRLFWSNDVHDYVKKINIELKNIARKHQIKWLDANIALHDTRGDWLPGVNHDTLHLTKKGYLIINNVLASSLSQ